MVRAAASGLVDFSEPLSRRNRGWKLRTDAILNELERQDKEKWTRLGFDYEGIKLNLANPDEDMFADSSKAILEHRAELYSHYFPYLEPISGEESEEAAEARILALERQWESVFGSYGSPKVQASLKQTEAWLKNHLLGRDAEDG